MIWPLSKVNVELLEDNGLLEALKKITDLFILLSNVEEMVVFVLFKTFELLVKISLQLEYGSFDELDLNALSLVTI